MIKEFIGIAIIFFFLTGLSLAAQNACVDCHTLVGATIGIVNDWKESNMR